MPTEDVIFKHAPASEVQLGVNFPNNLDVADERSRFHNLVRAEFPTVIMPEQNKMTYDFADYSLYTEDMAARLEIGMSYFRAASTRYPGFAKFRALFLNALGIFSKCYKLSAFTALAMTYRNTLPLEAHHKYEDCFTLDVRLPDELHSELFTGKGLLVFQKPEGFVTIEFDPQVGDSRIKAYAMNLIFTTQPGTPISPDENSLAERVDIAHAHLERFFFGVLTKQYLDYLKSK
jgi:uncharacterized protein (TIGR04255 family)